jgi:hypothetical protein
MDELIMATDAAARYQTMDGQSQVVQNLVYNSNDGDWELAEQAGTATWYTNLYAAVDDIEQYILDTLGHYKMDDFDVASDPKYVGYQDKGGNYYIVRYNIGTPAVDYTKGTTGYSTAWTNRASESYSDFASTF